MPILSAYIEVTGESHQGQRKQPMKQQELICGVKIKGAMARKATPGQRAWAGVQPCTVLKFNEGGLQEAIIPAGEKRSVREIITEAMQPA